MSDQKLTIDELAKLFRLQKKFSATCKVYCCGEPVTIYRSETAAIEEHRYYYIFDSDEQHLRWYLDDHAEDTWELKELCNVEWRELLL